jgi:kinetochore protein Mis13/DSN1
MAQSGGFVRKTRKSMAFQLETGMEPGDAMVPLADSETPMIKKNKELRAEQSRRSSLGTRGQRASSSIGKGDPSESRHSESRYTSERY